MKCLTIKDSLLSRCDTLSWPSEDDCPKLIMFLRNINFQLLKVIHFRFEDGYFVNVHYFFGNECPGHVLFLRLTKFFWKKSIFPPYVNIGHVWFSHRRCVY